MDVIGLKGPRIRLVPVDKERHLDNFVRWFNDPEVTRYIKRVLPLSRSQEEEWLDQIASSDKEILWAIHDENDHHIGSTGLHRIDWQNRKVSSGTLIGEKSAWGKGYGTEVMRTRTRYAFEQLGLHRIESEAFAENLASQRCLEKVGYKREGVARKKFFREGRWHDCILYAILDEDYFAAVDKSAAL